MKNLVYFQLLYCFSLFVFLQLRDFLIPSTSCLSHGPGHLMTVLPPNVMEFKVQSKSKWAAVRERQCHKKFTIATLIPGLTLTRACDCQRTWLQLQLKDGGVTGYNFPLLEPSVTREKKLSCNYKNALNTISTKVAFITTNSLHVL